MKNQQSIERLVLASKYLEKLQQADYRILDLNMIEPFVLDDKKYHPSTIVIERNQQLYSLRSDWTRSLLNYQDTYQLADRKFAYFGPVLRNFQTSYQAGAEIYKIQDPLEIMDSILLNLDFVREYADQDLNTFIINDEKLLDSILHQQNLSQDLKKDIYSKDISAIKDQLGADHILYRALTSPVSQQFSIIDAEFKDNPHLDLIHQLKNQIKDYNMRFILDLSFRSPQSYYNGLYFQAFLEENAPVISGGQYNEDAFGIGMNLSNGGLL